MLTITAYEIRAFFRRPVVALAFALAFSSFGPASAGSTTLEATYSSGISNGWVRVERWRDDLAAFTQESFPTDGRGDQSGQRKTFFGGDGSPRSSKFLMYYAPGWNTGAPNLCRADAGDFLRRL